MDRLVIRGGRRLEGSVEVRGAKNAVLPQIAAALLSSESLELGNVPEVTDVASMVALLRVFGVDADHGRRLVLNAAAARNAEAPYDIVRKMRASILVLAPLLARFGSARVSLPGGCAIGARPVDLHLKALAALGAQVEVEGGYITARASGDRLQGAHIIFSTPSVGATETALMGAVLARGESEILNAARDPEICDLALCLGAMGARIEGAGTHRIQVQGVDALHKARHELVTDRIEAGTYAIAAAITGGHLEILGARLEHLGAVGAALEHAGVRIWPTDRGLMISRSGPLHAVDVVTEPYPGFPTDLQAQFTALMTIASGASVIRETVFESRFMHVPELTRLGANISLQGSTALVRGVERLHGAQVMATDLRASVCLVLAGLAADGETTINRIYHLDRGYEALDRKLVQCGADIRRIAA